MSGKLLYSNSCIQLLAGERTAGRMTTECGQPSAKSRTLLTIKTDERRRSGRATKGQHSKNSDADAQSTKRKGKAQAKGTKQSPTEPSPPAAEEDEVIRCVCGEYEEEEDVERDMICCDQCSAWQHNDCMGLKFAKGEEPDEYYCERCKPENHKELLDKIARGEKPWEEIARIREQQAKEKKPRRRKGGKRGRKPRVSEAKSEMSEVASGSAAPTPSRDASQPVPESQQAAEPVATGPDEPSSSQKRKFDNHGDSGMQEPVSPFENLLLDHELRLTIP